MHGENALFVAKTFYKTLAVVKYIGGKNGLPGSPPAPGKKHQNAGGLCCGMIKEESNVHRCHAQPQPV